jgi:hypothetical protein
LISIVIECDSPRCKGHSIYRHSRDGNLSSILFTLRLLGWSFGPTKGAADVTRVKCPACTRLNVVCKPGE